MKTAVSIPDPVFNSADELAKRLNCSRSELYTRALRAFVSEHRDDEVTKALDAVYASEPSRLPDDMRQMQHRSLGFNDWAEDDPE